MTDPMPNVLISACLMGAPVRYDGRGKRLEDSLLQRLAAVCQLVPLCPELAGGFQVPRPPAEIESGMLAINGANVSGVDAPFGGVKWSGYGSEDGREGVMACMVPKTVHETD